MEVTMVTVTGNHDTQMAVTTNHEAEMDVTGNHGNCDTQMDVPSNHGNRGAEMDVTGNHGNRDAEMDVTGNHGNRDALCAALEREYVHDVYNKTAHHFVGVRYRAWPRVRDFLLALDTGALVADVGCGSGKYLDINKGVLTIGCDHSTDLLQVSGEHGRAVLSCDNLRLPFRDAVFDAVISIGVIHHFTTASRRARAVQELARVLRPGGRMMIYVWAMEQRHRKFKSQDVLVPWHLKHKPSGRKGEKSRKNTSAREAIISDGKPRPTERKFSYPHVVGNIDSAGRNSHKKRNLHGQNAKNGYSPPANNSSSLILNKRLSISKKGSSPTLSDAKPGLVRNADTGKMDSASKSQKEVKGFSRIKNKLCRILGVDEVAKERAPAIRSKDLKYRELIQQIVEEDSRLFTIQTAQGKVIPSVVALEGFAVREFPASSRLTPDRHPSSVSALDSEFVNGTTSGSINNEKSISRDSSKGDIEKGLPFEQKCTTWLEYVEPYLTNESSTKPVLKHQGNFVVSSSSEEDDDRDEVFESEQQSWVKVTSKVIKTMQTQVDNNTGCTCRKSEGADNTTVATKATAVRAQRSRNRSDSSWSTSFSSMSSDSDSSNHSDDDDIEEMSSLCAVCRGDSGEIANGIASKERDFKRQVPGASSHDSGYSETAQNQHPPSKNDAHKRFYHVFREGELDSLIKRRVPVSDGHQLIIRESFYDHANWAVIVEKQPG